MQEDFLHYIWKLKKINTTNLKTTNNEVLDIVSVGQHNLNSGPDFFNAQLKINNQLWAGNIEIHVKSSDWFVHNHEMDSAYDNVILHVVWEHDTEVFRKDNTQIPTVELKNRIPKDALENYQKLFSKSDKWINCENDFNSIDDFTVSNWLERLYFERLERKSKDIEKLLNLSANDWEAVLFKMLAKNFGLNVNGDAFLSLADSIDFSIVRKVHNNLIQFEALLFGQTGLLDNEIEEPYYQELQKEYAFLKQKFSLKNDSVIPLKFFRLRPLNFPTIRLSQFANLYHEHQHVFSKVIEAKSTQEIYDLFLVTTSEFWRTHYTFKKESKFTTKKTTKSFVDLLLINTIIPLKFTYSKYLDKPVDEEIIGIVSKISSEKNNIVNKFNELKVISKSAIHSQSIIELKQNYCDKNKCLQCAIGSSLLNQKM